MIIDDEEDILRLVEFALRKERIAVDIFCDPVKAFKHFSKYPNDYALVITDLRMPDTNGWEMIATLLSINDKVQFLIISAFLSEEPEWLKGKFSKDDMLEKPSHMSVLLKKVKDKLAIVA